MMDDPSEDPATRATTLAHRLHAAGHTDASSQLHGTIDRHRGSHGLLEALREACQSVLTAIESIDPASYAAIEEFRLDVDRRLNTGHTSG